MMKPPSASPLRAAEPPRRSRIVAHNGGRGYGGGEGAVVAILHGLAERGHSVILYCEHPVVLERARAAGVDAELFKFGGDMMLNRAARFASMLHHQQAEALLITTYRKFFIGGIAGRMARLPHVVGRIGTETDMPRKLKYRMALRSVVDAVVFNAESMRKRFLTVLPWYDPQRAITIQTGVRQPVESDGAVADLRVQLGIPEGARVIGSAGRLTEQKRFDTLIRVLATLPDDVHGVIAGRGEDEGDLRAVAAELGVTQRLHMLGYVNDLRPLHAALDVYMVTSVREGMSNAMLEALAAGIPVVSTPVSGAYEALEPLADGTRPGIVTSFDEREISTAVRAILADAPTRAAMARATRLRVQDRFAYERMIDDWESVLLTPRSDSNVSSFAYLRNT
jgi:glycosyltransferase involved in cell wall biosynthesis